MNIYLVNHSYKYAVEQMLLTMFPDERPVYPEEPPDGNADYVVVELIRGSDSVEAQCQIHRGKRTYSGQAAMPNRELIDKLTEDRLLQRIIKFSFYFAALKYTKKKPPWGALTGIRPGKIATDILRGDKSTELNETMASYTLTRYYDVDPERAELCIDTARAGLIAQSELGQRDICLYIGIPFCPSRCAYCSFVSQSTVRDILLIPDFLQSLYREIDATAALLRELKLNVISVYIGGGTPTTLTAGDLAALLSRVHGEFDLGAVREFTVEAGRPDTMTPEKLLVMARHGVTRVSVNPQSMSDDILRNIGRWHSAADVRRAVRDVRQYTDFDMNMDLIAGLPGDTPEGFEASLSEVMSFTPENITVHTLALKKGSRLALDDAPLPSADSVVRMLDTTASYLRGADYLPYYLYRQKFTLGGYENVGWSINGHDSLYNMCIMEELCSIISMGGGGSTKLCTGNGRIERIFNPKYPTEYIRDIERVIGDRSKMRDFFRKLFEEDEIESRYI